MRIFSRHIWNDGISLSHYTCWVSLKSGLNDHMIGCKPLTTEYRFLAATKQLYEWLSPSVRPSVCLSDTFLPEAHFELVRVITRHLFKLGPRNLDQRCKIPWLRSLLFWGLIELDMSNLTIFKTLFICMAFASLKYWWDLQKHIKTKSVPHPKWLRTNVFALSIVSWTVEQSSCIFSVTIAGFPVLDSAISK